MRSRDIYRLLKPISKTEKERLEGYGVRVTNPISATDTILYAHNTKKEQGINYTLTPEQFTDVNSFFKNAHQKAKSSDIDIWRSVTSNFYGVYPQEAISNYMEFLRQGNRASVMSFDIETLGSLNEAGRNIFTPTEMSFDYYKYVNGVWQKAGEKNYIIAPSTKVRRELEGIIRTVKVGGQLNPDQYRTIIDLMKYSGEGQKFGVKIENGKIVQHATWVDKLLKQEGVIDFNKTYYVDGRMIKPIEEVEKGLKFLSKQQNPVDVARDFTNFIEQNKDAFWSGQNIRNFDIRSISTFVEDTLGPTESTSAVNNFLSRKFLDMQQVLESIYQSPSEMLKDFGVQNMIDELNEGYLKQETLAKIFKINIEGQAHVASVDTHTYAQILDKSKSIIGKRIDILDKTPVIGPDGNIKYNPIEFNPTGFGFDTRSLERGERVIAITGAQKLDDKTIGFIVDQAGNIKNESNYLTSKVSYVVNEFYETEHNGKKMYGIELINETTGNKHVIYKENKAELQNFFQEKFRVTDGLSNEVIDYMNEFKPKDLARGRYRRMFSTRQGGGYWTTSRMIRAVEIDRQFKSGKITKQERDAQIKKLFSIEGKPIDSMIRDFELLKDRLDSEYEIWKPVIDEIEKQLDISPNRMGPGQNIQASIALSSTYEEMLRSGLSEHKEVVKVPEFSKYGITIFGRNGEEFFLNLESPAATEASIHGMLNRISHSYGNDVTLKKQYLINVVKNQIGAQLDLSEYEINEAIRTIEKISMNQKGTGYEVGELAAFLNRIKKEKEIFQKGTIEVESLNPRKTLELTGEDAFNIVNKQLQKVKRMQNYKLLDKVSRKNASYNVVRELDNKLNQLYDLAGFTKNRPKTIQESLNQFMMDTWRRIEKVGNTLDIRLVNTGSPSNPKLTLQIFDSLNRGVFDGAVDNVKNVVNIDLPLINELGYIQYGKIRRIAPLAFIDRYDGDFGKVHINTAFDRIINALDKEMDSIIKLATDGEIEEANNIVSRTIRRSIESLSSSKYGENINLDVTGNIHLDFIKRFTVHTQGYYTPLGGDGETWYDSVGNIIKLNDKLDAIQSTPQLLKKYLGDSVEVYWGSSKSGEALKGVMPLIDIRHDFALGFFSDAGRDNLMQYWNNRVLSKLSYEELNKNKHVHVGMLFGPEHMKDQQTPLVKVRIMDDADLLKAFGDRYDTLASLPTVYEDQFVVVDTLADSMVSVETFTKTVDGTNLPTLSENILDSFEFNPETKRYEPKRRYRVEYMEELYKYRSSSFAGDIEDKLLSGRFYHKGEIYLTGIQVLDDGSYEFEFEKIYGLDPGTKLFVGTEKGTTSAIIEEDLMRRRVGEGVSVIANSGWVKHKTYGEVFTGYINSALFEINKLDREVREKKAQELANLVNDIFNIDAVVVSDENGVVSIQYDSYKMLEKAYKKILRETKATENAKNVTKGYADFVDDINKILSDAGLSIRTDELVLPVLKANVDETFHYLNLGDEVLGHRGAKFGIQEIQNLRLRGFLEPAQWLEDMILKDISNITWEVARDEMNVLKYILLDQEVPENIERIRNIEGRWKSIRRGEVEGIRGLKKGLYTKEELIGSFIDPGREGFMLELPVPVAINLDEDGKSIKEIKEIFIGKVDPQYVKESDVYQLSGLPRKQLNIIEAIEDYNAWSSGQEVLDYRGQPVKSKAFLQERIQKAVQDYYDFIKVDLTGNEGIVFENIYSGRLFGSGGGLLQIMNPIPELAEDLKNIIDIDEKLLEKFTSQVSEPNVVYIGREKALRMAGFSSIQDFEDVLRKIEIGEVGDELIERVKIIQNMQDAGHHGILVRYPSIHRHSVNVVKFKIDDSIDEKGTKLSTVLAKALFGDSDGDRVSYVFASGNYDVEAWEKAFMENAKLLLNEFKYGDDGALESVRKTILRGAPFEEILELGEDLTMRIGPKYDELAFISKVLNPFFTGRLTNMGMGILQLGEIYFTDPTDIKHLQEGVGSLIQASISGKHLSAQDEARSAIEALNTIIKSIATGDIDPSNKSGYALQNLTEIAIGDKKLFTQSEVDAFVKLRELAGADVWTSMAQRIGYSETISHQDAELLGNILKAEYVPPTANLEYLLRAAGAEADVERVKKFRSSIREEVGRLDEKMLSRLDELSKIEVDESELQAAVKTQIKETGETVIRKLRNKMSGKLSALGIGVAFTGGLMAGAMITSDKSLPMDFVDAPGMRPRSHAKYTYTPVPGAYGTGYDINIRAMTTINRDVEELGGIVAQSMYNTTSLPMNININATDNRNDISQSWIQEQILKAINA